CVRLPWGDLDYW
nr:immunoglobulin heavy chain junction region [Macaca mulatta]MOX38598.1 immunoglobulin heavy chain junction region [Macaca mulatta]MOX39025.1 immunoglobulin heavy chain junction region [Macaca mulatta]MOX39379.1 immunoglobulin heavy chain junction region [Macaca mulatta]MOX39518.1 immunoglobulin heavy chain junction region [Macaca mulatta]